MQLVLLMGIQAAGKSTFCQQRFFATHVRINLDMLRTRRREQLLVRACVEGRTPFVVDNTNLTPTDRARYITPAREAGFAIHGYYFASSAAESITRNAQRSGKARVPDAAIRGARKRLEPPSQNEGFDALWFVRLATGGGGFVVEEWNEA